MTNITIRGVEISTPKWDMLTQLKNQSLVLPLVSKPITAAVAMQEEREGDEGMFIAAILDGVMKALAEADMTRVGPALLEGATYRNEHGVLKPLTLDNFEKAGLNLMDFYVVALTVIKENYGPLLKGGLQDLTAVLFSQTE